MMSANGNFDDSNAETMALATTQDQNRIKFMTALPYRRTNALFTQTGFEVVFPKG